MATKRKHGTPAAEEDPVDPSDELLFLCLGGGNEVGRSCHIVQYKGKTVMLDAGMHPALDGFAALPFYDDFDLSTVDVLLISHFHIDHAASLPYVLAKTNFRGRIFMTHSTKAIYKWLIQDSVRLGNTSSSSESNAQLYTESDHLTTFPRIEAIDYHTTHTVSSIRITPYPAGHVLGAAMFHLEIAGVSILFTGDYSREHDRHLIPASFPPNIKVDVLITESTYGVATHVPRVEREAALMKSVTSCLDRGGRVLLPVFALGRAQELLLIFDEYWGRHPEYQKIPIYYASNLARKCMVVYQTYIGAMNDNIKRLFRERMAEAEAAGTLSASGSGAGPWDFKFIRSLKNLDRFDDVGSCVMLASPGMMQSGVSRELLERWAPDQRNSVIITGYSVEGTMAKSIMNEPEEIPAIMNRGARAGGGRLGMFGKGGEDEKTMIPRRCTVQEYSFAAHVDGKENQDFIDEVKPSVIVLVHGEKHNMNRLRSKLLSTNATRQAAQQVKVYSPANTHELRIPIRTAKLARVVGKLAERVGPKSRSTSPMSTYRPSPSVSPSAPSSPKQQGLDIKAESGEKPEFAPSSPGELSGDDEQEEEQIIRNAVLVQNDLKLSLMAPEDLPEYAGLTTTTIMCRQLLRCPSTSPDMIRWQLEGAYNSVFVLDKETPDQPKQPGHDEHGRGDTEMRNADDPRKEEEEAKKGKNPAITDYGPILMKLLVMDHIYVYLLDEGKIIVEWAGGKFTDMLADAVLSMIVILESTRGAVLRSRSQHGHGPIPNEPDFTKSNKMTGEKFLRIMLKVLEIQLSKENITPVLLPSPNETANARSTAASASASAPAAAGTSTDDPNASGEASDDAVGKIEAAVTAGLPVPQIVDEATVIAHAAPIIDAWNAKDSYDPTSASATAVAASASSSSMDEHLTAAQTLNGNISDDPIPARETIEYADAKIPALLVKVADQEMTVYLEDFDIEGGKGPAKQRLEKVLETAASCGPLW